MNKQKALSIFAIALVVMLVAAGALQAQSNRSVFGWIITSRATIQGGGLTVDSDITQSNGDVTVADDLTVSPQPILTLTMNGWITPTGSFQPVRSAGAVSVSGARIAAGAQGDLLYLYNMGAQTITISETTGLVSAGNIALGTLDAATLVYSGTTWIQLNASNN